MPYREQGKHRSVDPTRFAMVPRNDIPRSAFDMRHGHKTTFAGGGLIPVYVEEVLPGDSFKVGMDAFARLANPIVPIMDNLYLESFFFFCPTRLLWDNWARFMGERLSPTDTTVFITPLVQLGVADTEVGSLADYFGITLNATAAATIEVLSFPFRAYNLIWNEWFRDEDIIDPQPFSADDGPDAAADYSVMNRGKRHDYFTTARPWPQKPLNIDTLSAIAAFPANYVPGGNMTFTHRGVGSGGVGAPVSGLGITPLEVPDAGVAVNYAGNRTQVPDWTHSTATTPFIMKATGAGVPDVRVLVNDLRTAVMVQGLMEKNARGGTRYTELVRSHFGVTSPDARLQRPEYLGGGRSNITINPVAQSVEGTGGRALGELAGVASTLHRGGFSQSFTEHGYIIGLVSVRADLTYQHGIERFWFRRTQFDFYFPSLAHLGEQAIFRKELFANGTEAEDDLVFGYQERWAEYRWRPSRISGAFRSNVVAPAASLDVWHLSQDYGAVAPQLTEEFITDVPPLARVLNETTQYSQQILFDSFFNVRAVRAMPMFSVPGIGRTL